MWVYSRYILEMASAFTEKTGKFSAFGLMIVV